MSLDDLNKELYNQNANAGVPPRTHEQSAYEPTVNAGQKLSPFEQEQRWNQPQKGLSPSQKTKLRIILGVLLLIMLAIGGMFFYQWWTKNAFHQDRVSISFEGPKESDSTQVTKYIIHYANNNRVTLKNAEIQLSYPENFQPTDNLNLKYLSPSASKMFIGDIKPMSESQVELKGIFYAPKDFPVYLHGEIHFIPSNGKAELSMASQIGVNITAAPVVLEISAPQQAVDGDSLDYVIEYRNIDIKSVANVQIRVDFPQGFQMSTAEPKPSEKGAYWYVGNLEPSQSGKILVHGQIKGNSNEGKNIIVSLGHVGDDNNFVVYNKKELTTKMASPILAIMQKVYGKNDNVVNAGENLQYVIAYQNTGTTGLRDAIITAQVKGKALDFSKINVASGSYDSNTNIITWKASDVPGLANINPGAGGTVSYSIPVKSVIPVENELDKNLIISSVAKIDSPDIPTPIDSNKIIGSNKLDLKLASKVLFGVKAYYTDEKIKNSGPIPMETGTETTFSVHWFIASISNDLADVKVVSSLPSGVRWTGKIYPSNEKITYNDRTNQLVWEPMEVLAGAGAVGPLREVVFQVGVKPQINQVGQPLVLINKSIFTAADTFVERSVNTTGDQKDTQLSEDPTVGYAKGKVAK